MQTSESALSKKELEGLLKRPRRKKPKNNIESRGGVNSTEPQNNIEWRGGVKSDFEPLSIEKLLETLGLTIKQDDANKLITFLAMLTAYTESDQMNISNNAPSSTGKSYIPTEIAQLFPKEDIFEIGYCSPTAFFHDAGVYNEGKKGYIVNLERKILIFLDQPHSLLLQHLRPLLSHDKKEIRLKITDKSQKAGLRTKNIFLRGFPSVVFCTAGLKIDEQESTRFLLLSPETTAEKIREAIYQKIKKESAGDEYNQWLEDNPDRKALKDRIQAIKDAQIRIIKVENTSLIQKMFFSKHKTLKPRHQRDIGRILSLIKGFALLNLWHRKKVDDTLFIDETDINNAFQIWDDISESQDLNIPPYIYRLYQEIILVAYDEKKPAGLTIQDISKAHFKIYGRPISDWQLRQEILPMLNNAGLITEEKDATDKRRVLFYPTLPLNISSEANNSERVLYVNTVFDTLEETMEGVLNDVKASIKQGQWDEAELKSNIERLVEKGLLRYKAKGNGHNV